MSKCTVPGGTWAKQASSTAVRRGVGTWRFDGATEAADDFLEGSASLRRGGSAAVRTVVTRGVRGGGVGAAVAEPSVATDKVALSGVDQHPYAKRRREARKRGHVLATGRHESLMGRQEGGFLAMVAKAFAPVVTSPRPAAISQFEAQMRGCRRASVAAATSASRPGDLGARRRRGEVARAADREASISAPARFC